MSDTNVQHNLEIRNAREAFDIVHCFTQTKTGRTGKIKSVNGTKLSKKCGRNTVRRYSAMASMSTSSRGAETNRSKEEDPCIPESEVRAAIVTCNSGKTQGEDNIAAALLKAGGEYVVEDVKHIVLETGESDRRTGQQVLLSKKRDPEQCKNYWTISLTSHTSMILLRELLNRLIP